jgi:hypothetical protein
MRHLVALMIFTIVFTVNPLYAGQNEYDDCLLKHLKNARIDLATQLIEEACDENYRGISIISEDRKKYNECLLEYLPGIESRDAVIEIQKVCRRKHL